MARRPDAREAEMLSEEKPGRAAQQPRASQSACREGLLRAGVSRLPTDLRPSSQSAPDADIGPGVEAVVEVAVNRLRFGDSQAGMNRNVSTSTGQTQEAF